MGPKNKLGHAALSSLPLLSLPQCRFFGELRVKECLLFLTLRHSAQSKLRRRNKTGKGHRRGDLNASKKDVRMEKVTQCIFEGVSSSLSGNFAQ